MLNHKNYEVTRQKYVHAYMFRLENHLDAKYFQILGHTICIWTKQLMKYIMLLEF